VIVGRRRTAALAAGCCGIATLVAGCMPSPATTQAQAVASLWTEFLIAAAIVGGTVWVLITVMILRYRRRASDEREPSALSDFLPIEIVWTAIPILIILVLFGLTLVSLNQVDARASSRVTVAVTAFRWQWRFDYQGTPVSVVGDPNTVAVMVVPVGEPIHIVLTSVDVDHAFYVPAFLFKRDAIPGHPNEFDLTITDPGDYNGQCAEFCGVYHDRMLLTVKAVPRPDFDAWLAAQSPASPSGAAPSTAPSAAPPSAATSAAAS
jgi:cytochrome c oxidase subunit 2